MCAFLFDHLDFEEITSGAFTDNPASLAVSRKVGYRENGVRRLKRREGELATNLGLVLTPGDLVRGEHPLEVEGAGRVPALDRARFVGGRGVWQNLPPCPARTDPLTRPTQRPSSDLTRSPPGRGHSPTYEVQGDTTDVAVKIRLKRLGKVKVPQYRIVVVDSRKKRDGTGDRGDREVPPQGGPVLHRRRLRPGAVLARRRRAAERRRGRDPQDHRRLAEVPGRARGRGHPQGGRAQARQARGLQRGAQGRRQGAQGRRGDQEDRQEGREGRGAQQRSEPKAEEPKAEEPKAEEPKAEEPKAEVPASETPEGAAEEAEATEKVTAEDAGKSEA